MRSHYLILLLLVSFVSQTASTSLAAEQEEFFEARVRPLLVKRCYECHRRKSEGGLRLDSRQAMLKGGESGPAIVPGNAEKSLLWKAVAGKHDELEMPPKKPLNEGEVKVFAKWIAEGAHWPQSVSATQATQDEHGISAEERAFWSFQPIRRPNPPQVAGWSHPIDAFVVSKHRQLGLQPAKQLSPRLLIRRLSFDLTGLPPSPAETAKFEEEWNSDPSQAYSTAIEAYLQSQAYGQRWAQHWLDLVRYADTAGDAADFPIPEAYKYRNYVIQSFQEDKPYDQFIREQLAGDLIPVEGDEQQSWNRIIATGYIALSRRIGVSPQGLRHITIEDTLNNLGKTFLGLSVGCARCHDHKFDPIPTADYYALYGIFDSTTYPHVGAEHKPYREDFIYRIGKSESDEVLASYRKKLAPLLKEERAAFERYREFQRKPINIPGYNRDVAWKEVLALREQIRQIAVTFPDLETAFAASEGDVNDVHVQQQGDPRSRGPLVRRGFLQVLGGQTVPTDANQSGRLELANWIASADNPLTARVIANRVWHHHFGRGLVASTSDFGVRGKSRRTPSCSTSSPPT